jgi:hypothetical protein
MNLNMPAPVINALTARGREAARRLVNRFAKPPAHPGDLSWDSHRWTRYRSAIAAIAALVGQVKHGYATPPATTGERTYAQLLARPGGEEPRAYPFGRGSQRQLAADFTNAIVDAATVTDATLTDDLADGAPQPQPDARIVPRA